MKYLSFKIFCFALFLSCFACTENRDGSDDSSNTFIKIFGGKRADFGYSVLQSSDEGFIICGSTTSFNVTGSDVYLIKTDKMGNEQWFKTIGMNHSDIGLCINIVREGGFIISGMTTQNGGKDACLIKVDNCGSEIWKKTFGGPGYDSGDYVQQTQDGGFIVCGTIDIKENNDQDIYLVKTNEHGDEEWSKTFGGTDWEWGYSALQTDDNCFILCGATSSFDDYPYGGFFDVYIVKVDINGNEIWSKTYGKKNIHECGYSIQKTDDGYIISGSSGGRTLLLKLDKNGNEEWSKKFNGNIGFSVQQTNDGGFILCGDYGDYTEIDVCFIKTDNNGEIEWLKIMGKIGLESAHEIKQTSDFGFILCGFILPPDAPYADVYLIKTDQYGNIKQIK